MENLIKALQSDNFIKSWKNISSDLNKCKEYINEIEKADKNDIIIIYLCLRVCQLTNEIDIQNQYCKKANKQFLIHNEGDDMLSYFEWTELRPYEYDINRLFINKVYFLSHNKYVNKIGRCIFNKYDEILYRYEVIDHIGSGAYSNVYKCKDHKENINVAVKCIRNDNKFKNSGQIEVSILSKLKHENISSFIKHFKYYSHTCIVFNLYGNNLYRELKEREFKPLEYIKVICITI